MSERKKNNKFHQSDEEMCCITRKKREKSFFFSLLENKKCEITSLESRLFSEEENRENIFDLREKHNRSTQQ